jgi:low temperature requirement protein LtrA
MSAHLAGRRSADSAQTASTLELFYDLVFVFAITQITHHLLAHLTWTGAGQSALLLLVVWWSWNYTTWATNELDPEATVVRLLVVAIMLASLMMAVAIPDVFAGGGAALFVGAYLTIQIGRSCFLTFAAAGRGTTERQRASRILIWFCVAGVVWIAGVLAGGPERTALWVLALAIDYGAPAVTYRVPGLARLSPSAWSVQSSHFAERYGLFMIIALGESIVITGETVSSGGISTSTAVAFALAFVSTAALWWLYFAFVAHIAERHLAAAENRTAAARDAYTYLHVLLVAGVVVSAVGDELIIAHPRDVLGTSELVAVVAGPVIYLIAHAAIRLRLAGSVAWRRLGGAGACLVVGLVARDAEALVVGTLLVLILIAVIVGDRVLGASREEIEAASDARHGVAPA